MYNVAVLSIHADEVLILFIHLYIGDALLEVERVAHQIEEKGKEELAPVLLEPLPAGIFARVDTVAEEVALRDDFRPLPANHVSRVEPNVPPSLSSVPFHVTDVIL